MAQGYFWQVYCVRPGGILGQLTSRFATCDAFTGLPTRYAPTESNNAVHKGMGGLLSNLRCRSLHELRDELERVRPGWSEEMLDAVEHYTRAEHKNHQTQATLGVLQEISRLGCSRHYAHAAVSGYGRGTWLRITPRIMSIVAFAVSLTLHLRGRSSFNLLQTYGHPRMTRAGSQSKLDSCRQCAMIFAIAHSAWIHGTSGDPSSRRTYTPSAPLIDTYHPSCHSERSCCWTRFIVA